VFACPLPRVLVLAAALVPPILFGACSETPPAPPPAKLSQEQLRKPQECAGCHPEQFKEWSGSMHAYAAEDPVFIALNKRMQRETNGAMGDFCVRCHAPVAVADGLTKDGLNVQELDSGHRGVTCYFCHSVESTNGPLHNNPIQLAKDGVMRAAISAPMPVAQHDSAYSPFLDGRNDSSVVPCGSCHDIVLPNGMPLERTFSEWKKSHFAGAGMKTGCAACHMPGRPGVSANVPNAPMRTIHDHKMAAVDLALTPFPEMAAQRAAVQDILDRSLKAKLCVSPDAGGVKAEVTLRNEVVGHDWPSGASQDRRGWVELVAETAGVPTFQSGIVADDQPVEPTVDRGLVRRQRIFDSKDKEVHMFWEAVRYESAHVLAPVTKDPMDPRFANSEVVQSYAIPGATPERVRMRVRMRPIDFDLIDDLVASGDLDPAIGKQIVTINLGPTTLEWKQSDGFGCVETK
jgi:hypothetical protein